MICGQPSPMLHDVARECQRLSARLPPDGWNDSKSTLEQAPVLKSKAVGSSRAPQNQVFANVPFVKPVPQQVRVNKQPWWKRLLRCGSK